MLYNILPHSQGSPLMSMSINMYIVGDLEFLRGPHTKSRKPHLMPKRFNFITWEKLTTLPSTRTLCSHNPKIHLLICDRTRDAEILKAHDHSHIFIVLSEVVSWPTKLFEFDYPNGHDSKILLHYGELVDEAIDTRKTSMLMGLQAVAKCLKRKPPTLFSPSVKEWQLKSQSKCTHFLYHGVIHTRLQLTLEFPH